MKRHVGLGLLALAVTVLFAPVAGATPVTDPNDPRTWQGATVETFRSLLGFATREDLINAGILDDGTYPLGPTVDVSLFAGPGAAPCEGPTAGLNHPELINTATTGAGGFSFNPSGYDYSAGGQTLADFVAFARCLDMWWIQDLGDGDITTGDVWDLGGPSNQAAVFPIIDHGPLPQEAIEYTVYLSNNPSAQCEGTDGSTCWVLATLDKVYLEGWISTWIADGFATVWRLPGGQTFRYVNVVSGGKGSLIHDGDDEIDTVIGLTSGGEPVCPGSQDMDGDGVCDETDNCPTVHNPLQEDSDDNGVGDACDLVSCEAGDPDEDGICNDVDNCPEVGNPDQTDTDGDGVGDACEACSGDADADGVCDDFDACPGTAASVAPTVKLGTNRWADIDNDGVFDTRCAKGPIATTCSPGPGRSYTVEQTRGCNCDQIIERLGLGQGHRKHGCSISAMDDWIAAHP